MMTRGYVMVLLMSATFSFVLGDLVQPNYQFIEEWTLWKNKHYKSYETQREDLERHIVWLSNREYILHHNANYRAGVLSSELALNRFADMTDKEFADTQLTYKPWDKKKTNHKMKISVYVPPNYTNWPEYADWRQRGAVTYVKDQENCGASYAFAAMGALEGSYALAFGKYLSLSEQNIVDCSLPEGNNGCQGGNMYNSFMYVVFNDGVNTEKHYPYQGMQLPSCNFSDKNIGATISGVIVIKSGSETDLQAAIAYAGPVAIAIDGSTTSFRFYSHGVLDTFRCSNYKLNHAMLVIGYGKTQTDNKEYWTIKNSWGTSWGEDGYIRMSRNRYNQCGIASDASYPSL